MASPSAIRNPSGRLRELSRRLPSISSLAAIRSSSGQSKTRCVENRPSLIRGAAAGWIRALPPKSMIGRRRRHGNGGDAAGDNPDQFLILRLLALRRGPMACRNRAARGRERWTSKKWVHRVNRRRGRIDDAGKEVGVAGVTGVVAQGGEWGVGGRRIVRGLWIDDCIGRWIGNCIGTPACRRRQHSPAGNVRTTGTAGLTAGGELICHDRVAVGRFWRCDRNACAVG